MTVPGHEFFSFFFFFVIKYSLHKITNKVIDWKAIDFFNILIKYLGLHQKYINKFLKYKTHELRFKKKRDKDVESKKKKKRIMYLDI